MTTPVAWARLRLDQSLLYLVTSAQLKSGVALSDFLARALEGGVDAVQLREKGQPARFVFEQAETFRRRTEEFDALFIVNDRVDLAIACGADGCHVGQDDLPLEEVRRLGGSGILIGISTHSEDQFDAAADSEADYVAVGPVYSTPTHPGRKAVSNDLIRYAARSVKKPFFAIGGIDQTNIGEVMEAGARRVAVVRAIAEAEDPAREARRLKEALMAASRRTG